MRAPLTRTEKRAAVLLLLLCLLPVVVAGFIERRKPARAAPIRVSAQTLAKYTSVALLGGVGYIRLGDQGWEGGPEGSWDIYVTGHNPRPIEAHPDTPQGWRVEFVEELPDWKTSTPQGSSGGCVKTIGVRVTVPKGARAAVLNGATAGMFHTRDGVQIYYAEGFQVAPHKTHGKATLNSRAGRAGFGNQRAHAAAPGR